jgi:exosortase/archaeosortase family protein
LRRRTAAAAVAVALAVKFAVDALPDAAVAFGFMRPAARLATIYLGAAFDPSAMAISARGMTITVVRACSATDFFSMAFTLLCFAMPIRHLALRIPAAVASAWLVAVLANAVRLVLLVYADGFFPASQIPAVHMAIGIAVFLTVFALLCYTFVVKASCKRSFRQDLQD